MKVSCRKNLFLLYGISFFQGMVFYAPIATLYRRLFPVKNYFLASR